jgi:hypothetical protein
VRLADQSERRVLMVPVFKVRVSLKGFLQAADMVRHDHVYGVSFVDEKTVEVLALRYTPDRWRSFNVEPQGVTESKVWARDYQDLHQQALGFLAALRVTRRLMEMVEKNEHLSYLWPLAIEG